VSGGIYLIHDNNWLVEMTEQPYGTEDLLQKLLADYPNLLAGDQIDSNAPRRWLLVAREVSLASEEGGSGRWSVDHLFLDQDAIPTIVEVKRSSNTQIRREVVGQMLDYAANAVVHWPVERLQAEFEANPEYEQDISDLLEDPEADPEEFWQKVKINLKAGKVRLVFVSDEIPTELRRIVEFLNQQMDPAEVLAVEIKQYVSQDSNLKTLVPRIIGQTAKAQDSKPTGSRSGGQWDETSFFEELESREADEAGVAGKILEWAKDNALDIRWGKGGTDGSFTPMFERAGLRHQVISVYTYGSVEIKFEHMRDKPPFDDESKRLALRDRLNEIPDIGIPIASVNSRRPSFRLSLLENEKELKQFLEVLDWFVQEVKAT
jgi:hypothetical protein